MTALGIDTSNYTTSAAVYDGRDINMSRKLIDVKKGERGIRQSEGVFIHNRELGGQLENVLDGVSVDTVGVSTRPRSVIGSYMPVFTVGHGYARAISAALHVPLLEFSHQDGHIMAGIFSAGCPELLTKPFISVHISGGTTEIIKSQYNGYNFTNEIIGGTLDISAGQLIDRCGTAMGIKFPCGAELEKIAEKTSEYNKLKLSVKESYINFSGAETHILRSGFEDKPKTARTVLCHVRDALVSALKSAVKRYSVNDLLLVGGVASNGIIREGVENGIRARVHFASRELSTDNAAGIAILAYLAKSDINLREITPNIIF